MAENRKKAAALGIFDGVHSGHRAVIGCAAEFEKKGLLPSVFTFRNTSLGQKQGRSLEYIYTDENKERIIRGLGISEICSRDFGSVRSLSGEDFARQVLVGELNAAAVVCGEDFRFGYRAACGAAELCRLGKRLGFEVAVVPDTCIDGEKVSSSRIRTLISEGRVKEAAALLGSGYTVYGEVVHGAQLGRTIGFPTINQLFGESQLIPAAGVYASRTEVDGVVYPSMTNVGIKPTVKYGGAPLAETHIQGFSGDIYGRSVVVELVEFIRPEQKFDSIEQLRHQISADSEKCRIIL